MRILLLTDDFKISADIISLMALENIFVAWTTSVDVAIGELSSSGYSLAIFDWTSTINACDVCSKYAITARSLPVILLSDKASLAERLAGFRAGADDYILKPFDIEELIARVRAIVKRSAIDSGDIIELGDLKLDLATCILHRGEMKIALMPKEFIVLEFLMRNKNRIFSAPELRKRLWHSQSTSTDSAVKKCLTRLRNKLDQGQDTSYLVTVKGLGYMLSSPDTAVTKNTAQAPDLEVSFAPPPCAGADEVVWFEVPFNQFDVIPPAAI